jgi:prepilin-type N-terminal cleavage/methylation domain-containing protein
MVRALIRVLRRESGFTLIELMIVILVILILAAILIPQLSLARERARKATCVSNQRNLETGVAMWAADNPTVVYRGRTMDNSTPSFTDLTGGTTVYVVAGTFQEPDDPNPGNARGDDYYLSNGDPSGRTSSANPAVPSYGHVACAYAADPGTGCPSGGDPWVNCYEGAGNGAGLNHTRGISASP